MDKAIIFSPLGFLRLTAENEQLVGLEFIDKQQSEQGSSSKVLNQATMQLREYFLGERERFTIPLAAAGTDFQKLVWEKLKLIPYAETISYKQLAEAVGQPTAYRAVGSANGKNPIPIVIPCHRVIANDGSLGGYGGKPWRKQYLLELEAYHL